MSLVAFVGDPHFGSSGQLGHTDPATQLNSRLLDYIKTFNALVDNFERQGVRILALCGDQFDSRTPPPAVVNAFSECLRRTIDKGFKVVMIAGNHDQSRSSRTTTIDLYDSLKVQGVSVFTDFGVKSFEDFHLVCLPYRDRKQFQASTNEEAVQAIKQSLATLTANLQGPKLVLGHFMMEGTVSHEESDNFSVNEIVLPNSTFDGLDAAFLGHIHNAEVLKRKGPVIVNVGSMERINFGDRKQPKSTTIVDTADIENFKVIETPTRSMFELAFDYTDRLYKTGITDRIIADVQAFVAENDVEGAIVRVAARMKDLDVYYVNQERIKEILLASKIDTLAGIQLVSTTSKQSRDQAITEAVDAKKAFGSYVKNLTESEAMKKSLVKAAEQIIEEVDGK